MGQRARILTQVTGFRGWKVAGACWESERGQRIDLDAIEGVSIPTGEEDRPVLRVSTDEEECDVGAGLPREALEWLKRAILLRIAG